MSEMFFASQQGRVIPKEDKIFGINNRAKAMIAREGKDKVVNATLGALLDDKGDLIVLSSVTDVFRNLEKVGYTAGAILIDGKIEALSIGGQLNKNTMTVHVEKANTEFRGMYQAINNEFCKNVPEYIKYMNREEDMGIANLRKAKLSYKPCELVEKYIIVFK